MFGSVLGRVEGIFVVSWKVFRIDKRGEKHIKNDICKYCVKENEGSDVFGCLPGLLWSDFNENWRKSSWSLSGPSNTAQKPGFEQENLIQSPRNVQFVSPKIFLSENCFILLITVGNFIFSFSQDKILGFSKKILGPGKSYDIIGVTSLQSEF